MSIETEMNELIRVLIDGTQSEQFNWQATADENTFRLASAIANIRLTRSEGFLPEIGEPYVSREMSILNDRGRVIEEYILDPETESESEIRAFDELYRLARRSAYKTSEVLGALLIELRNQLEKTPN